MLSTLIQAGFAAALAAASLLLQSNLFAAALAPSVTTEPTAALAPADLSRLSHRVDFAALDVPYAPGEWAPALDRVFPEFLTAPAALKPTGSLTWAGIDSIGTEQPFWVATGDRGVSLRDIVDEAPDADLLTARPAPEPPTIVMAGFALTAGAVWTGYRRRQKRTATAGEQA